MSKKAESDRASAGEGGRLDTGQVVDMGGEPVGDRRDMAPDLVELDDPQRLVAAVIPQQGLETLCGRQLLEGQRAPAAIVAPKHPVGVSRAIFLGVDACHNALMLRRLFTSSPT
jgi:hypothetical protein